MCDISVLTFFIDYCKPEEFNNKRVLEVGSRFINGSIRPFIEKFLHPKEYVGIDIIKGKFVDKIVAAEDIVSYFGENTFDVVIASEIIEHVRDWRLVLQNLKDVLTEKGYLFITTRSKGFPLHDYPFDYWRFEIDDMKEIFSDFKIKAILKDNRYPGLFFKAQKPEIYKYRSMDNIKLYSIIHKKRIIFIPKGPSEEEILKNKKKKFEEIRYAYEPIRFRNKDQYKLEQMGLKKRLLNSFLKRLKKIEEKILYHLEKDN